MRKIHKIITHWSATPYTGSPVNVNIIDSNGKTIKYGTSADYTDPINVGSLYMIEYIIYGFIPYWLVENRIYS